MRSNAYFAACGCAAFLTCQAVAGVPAGAVAAGPPVASVWHEQRVNFVYFGRTSRYSCDGLRDKVRAMLLDLGARRDLKVTTSGCILPFNENSPPPGLRITFSAAALPDPALKPLQPGDLARFEAFVIAADAFRNMGIGDCELVAAFTRQILPKFVTRDVKSDISCVPYQVSGNRFLVKGEILRPLPQGEPSPRSSSR